MQKRNRVASRRSGSAVRKLSLAIGSAGLLVAHATQAIEFDVGGAQINIDNLVTIGGAWRMENRDPNIIGKSNLQPGLCTARRADGSLGNKESGTPETGNIGSTCTTANPALNNAYVAAPGFMSPNSDNGNLNYDRYDMVNATAKYDIDMTARWGDFDALVTGVYFFDNVNKDFLEKHPDTTLQPALSPRSKGVEHDVGEDFDLYDSYITWRAPFIGGRTLSVRVGNQRINWGESTFLAGGSINNVNAPDQNKLRLPGFQIKELFLPHGMVSFSTDIMDNLSTELFYQYDWRAAHPDAAGSFYSTSDIAGGGTYAMLSFAKAPEDPDNLYDPSQNPNDAIGLISSAGRTLRVIGSKLPDEGNQYGLSLKYLADWLNNGTELGFYYQRYHSRLPLVSANAAQATCIKDSTNDVATSILDCGVGGGIGRLGAGTALSLLQGRGVPVPQEFIDAANQGRVGLANEPLPLDTVELFLDYPENLDLYGLSFNTPLGDWAWSGEVAYRPRDPLQLNSTDLIFAALQPAFPNHALAVPGVGNIPGRRVAVPDYVETLYRGHTVQPGQYIPGYEFQKTWNFGTTLLKTIGGDNLLRADQIFLVVEAGANYVQDMPELSELQFNGPGTDTHYSSGADGSNSGLGDDSADTAATGANSGNGTPANPGCSENYDACRQNPQHESSGFATDFSWGYRLVASVRYQDAIMGVNLEPVVGVFHDVDGITPGPAANFVKGRVQGIYGLRFDYLSKWSGELRYTSFGGGGVSNQLRDRDNVFLFVAYSF